MYFKLDVFGNLLIDRLDLQIIRICIQYQLRLEKCLYDTKASAGDRSELCIIKQQTFIYFTDEKHKCRIQCII